MNWAAVNILVMHEFRMLLRDRRTVVLALILPLILLPLILFGMKFMGEWRKDKLENTLYIYSVVGTHADSVRAMIKRGQALIQDEGNGGNQKFTYREVPATHPDSSLASGRIHFYLQAEVGAGADSLEADFNRERRRASNSDSADSVRNVITARYPAVPVVTIFYRGNRDESNTGGRRLQNILIRSRAVDRNEALHLQGFTHESASILSSTSYDLATKEQVAGSSYGRFLTLFLIFFTLSGATVVAMDSIAGEKERGSLETLLTTSVSHIEIIVAKQITILTVALGIVFIQVANLLIYITSGFIDLPDNLIGALPFQAVLMLLVLYIPVAVVISSLLLMVSAFAKSYKETQLYYLPVFFSLCILASAAFLPSISSASFVVLVPVANVSVAVREVMVGEYNWPMLFLTCLVMIGTAAMLLRFSSRMLSMEKLITAQDTDEADLIGGAALFPKRVILWFVGMWVLLLTASANMPALATLESQVLFNMFGVMLGTTVVMLRVYKLDWRTALAIRPVRPIIWPIILILIPVTQITGTGVVALANEIFPFPDELLEEFARQIVPADYPLWKIILMVAVTPGILEEMAFRGMLLYGLHRRLRPLHLILVVGMLFGFFHTSLFRIIPTGYLGMVLTSLVVLTGSIFPAMVLHVGNNAFALILFHYGIKIEQLSWYYYVLSCVLFIGSFYGLYRLRTLYPGLLSLKKYRKNPD